MASTAQQAALSEGVAALREKGLQTEATTLEQIVPAPTQGAADKLWMVLVAGLVGLLAITVAGLIYAISDDKSTDVVVTIFTGLLTGLLGLFIKSPVGNAPPG